MIKMKTSNIIVFTSMSYLVFTITIKQSTKLHTGISD